MSLSKMTKEELELLSYTKIAKMYLEENKKTMNTADLFKEICSLLDLGEAEYQNTIADFFESLTISKDFISHTEKVPFVSVPVLSKTTFSALESISRYVPPFISIPFFDAPPIPPKNASGTEITSAQGQDTTRNDNALYI